MAQPNEDFTKTILKVNPKYKTLEVKVKIYEAVAPDDPDDAIEEYAETVCNTLAAEIESQFTHKYDITWEVEK